MLCAVILNTVAIAQEPPPPEGDESTEIPADDDSSGMPPIDGEETSGEIDPALSIPDGPGYAIVDYDSDGVPFAVFLPGVGYCDGEDVMTTMSEWLSNSFDDAAATDMEDIAAFDGSIAAALASGVDGFGWSMISVNGVIQSGESSALNTMANAAYIAFGKLLNEENFPYIDAEYMTFEFVLAAKTKNDPGELIPQSYIFITDSEGNKYRPTNGEELQATLELINNAGNTVDEMIIKGHANGELITIGPGGDQLSVPDGPSGCGVVTIGNTADPNFDLDITDVLNDVCDANTSINLRGCSTLGLAADLDDALGGDPSVSGTPIPVIGIPWTGTVIGPWWTY